MLIVLAGSYRQYRFLCNELNIDHREHMFVGDDVKVLYGLDYSKLTFVRYGTWYELSDEVIDEFKIREQAGKMKNVNITKKP